jgi:hypothetical protein
MYLDTMAQVNAVFSRRKPLGVVETNVLVMFFDHHLNRLPCCPMYTFLGSLGMLYMLGIFKARSSFTSQRKHESFLGRSPQLPSFVTSALKMETACFSEMLALTYKTTERQSPRQHQYHKTFIVGSVDDTATTENRC